MSMVQLKKLSLTNNKAKQSLVAINNGTMVVLSKDDVCPKCSSILTEDLTGFHTVACNNDSCNYYYCDVYSSNEEDNYNG